MSWRRAFCGAPKRRGGNCGNPSPDGRGGWCTVHQRMAERDRREARQRARAEETERDERAEP